MTRSRDMDKKHQKYLKNGSLPPFVTPKIFFKNQALSLLYPYGALTLCKKLEKTNELFLRYLKTDGPQATDKADYYGPPRVDPGSKMHKSCIIYAKLFLPQTPSSVICYLTTASCKIAASSIFWAKVEKMQKTNKLCIIMLINASKYNFWSSLIIFDL